MEGVEDLRVEAGVVELVGAVVGEEELQGCVVVGFVGDGRFVGNAGFFGEAGVFGETGVIFRGEGTPQEGGGAVADVVADAGAAVTVLARNRGRSGRRRRQREPEGAGAASGRHEVEASRQLGAEELGASR